MEVDDVLQIGSLDTAKIKTNNNYQAAKLYSRLSRTQENILQVVNRK
jgi:hypothetical protein